MIEVSAVYTDRATRAPVVELRVGGSLFVGGLIQMLAAEPGSDSKRLAAYIAEATGQVIHPPAADLNEQILHSREREAMRDRQLSELIRRLKEIWESSREEDRYGHVWDRERLMEWVRGLTTSEFLVEAAR